VDVRVRWILDDKDGERLDAFAAYVIPTADRAQA
jgi:hypothetical protein